MIVRALDINGDWIFGKGLNDYKSGRDALAQNIQTRLNSFLGDCFFETSAGIDWFNLLGGKSKLAIEIQVSAVLLNTDGVTAVLELSSVLNEATRDLTISYKVSTNIGPIENVIVMSPTPGDFLVTEDGDSILTEDGKHILTESGNVSAITFIQDELGNTLITESGDPMVTEDSGG